MKEKFARFIKERNLSKWFQRDNLIIIVLSGILLLIIALPTEETDVAAPFSGMAGQLSGDVSGRGLGGTAGSGTSDGLSAGTGTLEADLGLNSQDAALAAYEAAMEQKLKKILEGMEGAGKVEVMITFASTEELVVEKDRPVTRSNTTEADGEGGSRSINQIESKETTVFKTQGNDSTPYVVKTLTPKVEGVLVAAQGAGTGEVTKTITEAVQALFDLEAHKIKVIRMKD